MLVLAKEVLDLAEELQVEIIVVLPILEVEGVVA